MTEQENNTEKQKSLNELKDKTISKLSEAIELNKLNNRSKESRNAKAEACALLLVSIRAGVQFDQNDPVFQIFVQKQSWRDAMIRACKEVCDPTTAVARNVIKIIKLIPAIEKVGNFMENFLSLFEKNGVRPQESVEVYNQDIWNDFYDDLPKDGGGPSLQHKNYNESQSEFQKLLSQKATDGQHFENKANPSNIQKYLSQRAIIGQKATAGKIQLPKRTFNNQQFAALSKNQSSNNAA